MVPSLVINVSEIIAKNIALSLNLSSVKHFSTYLVDEEREIQALLSRRKLSSAVRESKVVTATTADFGLCTNIMERP